MFAATEAHDDDGLPHTLAHLVFLGSEDYPYKVGYSKTMTVELIQLLYCICRLKLVITSLKYSLIVISHK